MKPALYYSLRKGWNHGLGYRPVAITSEKGRRWYGRDLEHNHATNGNIRDLVGKFDSQNAIERAVQGLLDIAAIYKPGIADLDAKRKEVATEWAKVEREFITGEIEG